MTTQARPAPGGDDGAPHPSSAAEAVMKAVRQFLSRIPSEARSLWQGERQWLLVLVPLVLMAVGPLEWFWITWGNPDSPLSFQPFVPLGVAYLAWANRDLLQQKLREREVLHPVGSRRRNGTILLAVAGCALMVPAYLTMLTPLAMLGLLLTAAGVLLHLYGGYVFPAFARPLLFALTMVPVPGTLIAQVTSKLQTGCALIAGQVLRVFHPSTKVFGNFIVMDNYSAQVSGPCSGMGILLPVGVLTLLLALARRMKAGHTLIVLGVSALISTAMNVLRIVMMGMVGTVNANWANTLHDANSWVFTALAFYLTFLAAGRIGPRRRRIVD